MDVPAKIIKWTVLGILAAWFISVGWIQFLPLIPDEIDSQQAEIRFRDRLAQCTGSYNERYKCKSELFRERDTATFVPWAQASAIVFLPMIFFYSGFTLWVRVRERRRQADLQEATVQRRQEIRAEEEKQREENRILEQERLRLRNIESRRRSEISRTDDNARAEGRSPPLHILLIPENENETERLAEALKARDCHVITSADTDDGLIGIDKLCYDVVVMGILTDGIGGIEGIKKIRESRNDIKIIAVTAGNETMKADDILRAAEAVGADMGLSNLHDSQEFAKAAVRLGSRKRAQEESFN